MLTKENSSGFNPSFHYPTYEYKTNGGLMGSCDGSRIVPTPEGYTEVIVYHNIDGHFTAYLKQVAGDHENLTDGQLLAHPYGNFIGRGRNARWIDEIKRRNLESTPKR